MPFARRHIRAGSAGSSFPVTAVEPLMLCDLPAPCQLTVCPCASRALRDTGSWHQPPLPDGDPSVGHWGCCSRAQGEFVASSVRRVATECRNQQWHWDCRATEGWGLSSPLLPVPASQAILNSQEWVPGQECPGGNGTLMAAPLDATLHSQERGQHQPHSL